MKNMENTNQLTNIDININDIYIVYKFFSVEAVWKYKQPDRYPYNALLLVLGGEAAFFINGENFHIKKDDILFIPSSSRMSSRGVKGVFSYISIHFSFYDETAKYPFNTVYHISNSVLFQNLFNKLEQDWETKSFGYKLLIKSTLYKILNLLIYENQLDDHRFKNYNVIKDAIVYMQNNYFNQQLTVEKIAEVSKISSVHFRKLFKEAYHTSPVKYISNIRMIKAMELLEFSKMSVKAIAQQVGYSDVYYFNRLFKNTLHMTPLEYRKNPKRNYLSNEY